MRFFHPPALHIELPAMSRFDKVEPTEKATRVFAHAPCLAKPMSDRVRNSIGAKGYYREIRALQNISTRCFLTMNSPSLPNIMFLSDDQNHQTIERIEAIQNLLYLIRMDASDPAQVTVYASQADRLLREMQFQIFPDRDSGVGRDILRHG